MAQYSFTLTLTGMGRNTPGHEDALYNAGCDDALLSSYGDTLYLEFDRQAESAREAIASAIAAVEGAGIGAVVSGVDGMLLGLSDIAQRCGLSRQAITMLKDGTRGPGDFPDPIQRLNGASPLWAWVDVAQWMADNGRISHDAAALEMARELNSWHLALRIRAAGAQEEVTHRLDFLSVACD